MRTRTTTMMTSSQLAQGAVAMWACEILENTIAVPAKLCKLHSCIKRCVHHSRSQLARA